MKRAGLRKPFRPVRAAQRGRLGPAGAGLLVFGVLMLYFALQSVRGGEHPLASSVGIDRCARLGPQPAAVLPELSATPTARIPGMEASRASTCYWPIAEAGAGAEARGIGLIMMTHASLRAEGNRGGTARYVETFVEESRAGGSEVVPAQGAWKNGATIRHRSGDLWLLAEDDGVVLWLTAQGVEREALLAFGSAVATRLRAKDTSKK